MAGEAGRNWEERRRGISNQDRLYEKKILFSVKGKNEEENGKKVETRILGVQVSKYCFNWDFFDGFPIYFVCHLHILF